MPSRVRIRGEAGSLRWGYRVAADVAAWTFEFGILDARLTNVRAHLITQRPLTFVVSNAARGTPDFRRDLVNVTVIENSRLTAQLAPRNT